MAKERMSRTDGAGKCEHCGIEFPYRLINNGFNESAYAYCSECGTTAILDFWRMPEGLGITPHQPITADNEDLLQACSCGGRFRASAEPRCPQCQCQLSATSARTWLEANAPGTAQGWRWQNTWHGLYAIVIAERAVHNNWAPKCAI